MSLKFTTHIRPSDVEPFSQAAVVLGLSKTKLLQTSARIISEKYFSPRSIERIPVSQLKEVGYAIGEDEMQNWKLVAQRMQLPLHHWIRECVVPAAISMAQNYTASKTPNAEIGVTFSVEESDQYRQAALAQKMDVVPWIVAQLKLAAEYHIANPKHELPSNSILW